ncbi:glycoside hydrolase N-terminal domain-containing protein [Pedobacter sp. L105]|uniref:glycoside hydrolase family 95 protein n=1 Tax=Pedobacter sp. L105 TaxID=1641871 RepID=UPI0020B14B1E|nr:glycoside hydrolase family 95 protein [Pedobacter sp. L105]
MYLQLQMLKSSKLSNFSKQAAVTIFVIIFLGSSMAGYSQSQSARLWYKAPANYWEASLPLGNGRLGAMPDGGIFNENIVLNDITLWSGGRQDADQTNAAAHLSEIRQLLFAGKNIEAQQVMSRYFVSKGKGSGMGNGANVPYGSYQILGNLKLNYQYGADSSSLHPSGYHRELSLNDALATTRFTIDHTNFTREYFTSFDDDVVMVRLSASELKKISFVLKLSRPEHFKTKADGVEMQMYGQLNNGTDGKGMQYRVKVHIKHDGGNIIIKSNSLQLVNANSAIIYISPTTSYKNINYIKTGDQNLAKALSKPYAMERTAHIKKFQRLFHRVTLNLGSNAKDSLPTDKRLAAFALKADDPGLPALYFQYGRYLLISSTRPGLLPPNLQGLWANTVATPWNGDYHLNINIQMNHWLLDVTNLGVLNEPFYTLVKGLVKPGEQTAKTYYGANGWVAHVITNIWGYTSPGEDYSWGSFNTGSAWLCQMLWQHYEFSRDKAYLNLLYPILKGSAEFYLSALVKEPTHGWLVTAPSSSPENAFFLPDGKQANVCDGPTIDNQILRSLFAAAIVSSKELNKDGSFRHQLEIAIKKLPPDQVGKDGRLMEWLKEYKEVDPHHRHVSHLWGLYPGHEITTDNPKLADAAKASLIGRGDDGTGWSLAWKVNFWARLHDGGHSFQILRKLFRPVEGNTINMSNGGGSYINLFCAHPPFQIDGNFGGTAGIAEMLLQSQNGYLEFLPALPEQWKNGSFSGLCGRGGIEVSAKWISGKLQFVALKATVGHMVKIKVPDDQSGLTVTLNGKKLNAKVDDNFLHIFMKKGDLAKVKFD